MLKTVALLPLQWEVEAYEYKAVLLRVLPFYLVAGLAAMIVPLWRSFLRMIE